MRSRIIILLAIALTACTEITDPSSITAVDNLMGVKKTTPMPAMTMSCLEHTRSAVMQLFFQGTLTEEESNMLLNRIDNVIRQVEKDHARPASNVSDSYNQEVQKFVDSGRLTTEQAGTVMMSFECIAPVSIVAGETHSCVLLSDNSVWCWGNNNNGQLGNGSTSNSSAPVRVAGLAAQQLEAGGFNTCAITSGRPWCWGRNEWGQLGIGSTTMSTTPAAVSWPVSDAVAQISVGWALACARTASGETYCWGQNSTGGVGSPATTDMCSGNFCSMTPTRISTARTYADVDVGIQGGCALDADGLAYCWGTRRFGALGDNVTTARCTIAGQLIAQCTSEPTLVAGDNHFRSIQFGAQHVCAVRTDSQAMCWGANDGGELGVGSLEPFNAYTPMAVVGGQAFASLSAVDGSSPMQTHVCGLSAAGDASCWGWNENAELGAADKDCTFEGVASPCATSPQAVSGLKFKQIAAGRMHSCGITVDNRVLCWGGNALGQLGDGTTTPHAAPAPIVSSWSDTP